MAWEEWERLKSAVAERHSAQMQLNQLPGDQGANSSKGPGASGRLRSDKKAWSKAGEGVGDLRDNIGKALTKLGEGQTGLGKGSGCSTAVAQKGVYDSWERRVKDIGELCDGLAGVLEKAGTDQLRTDEAIKAEIARLKVGSEDASTTGGSGKGR
ncbi:hypothetical protein AB0L35_36635 [Streptomyces sp. NPDC052309]|uniref:Uncharacterized protein n=1 Tax=Streptomyces griseicoloratus TaxID=2752516 RepID=A0A926L5Q7_9ACTN|nr:hypothetical protein [Streptomyces griseicoloratus]MBD0420687.1 hypothetical protein [Streptomyces griseicoloratus]